MVECKHVIIIGNMHFARSMVSNSSSCLGKMATLHVRNTPVVILSDGLSKMMVLITQGNQGSINIHALFYDRVVLCFCSTVFSFKNFVKDSHTLNIDRLNSLKTFIFINNFYCSSLIVYQDFSSFFFFVNARQP